MISSLELAKLCGVSQGTVDRALHDRPGISPKTRAHVLKIASAHGYRPNPTVHELLSGKSNQVLGVMPGTMVVFFMDLMNAMSKAMSAAGLRLVMVSASDAKEQLALLEEFASRRYAGAVVVPPEKGLEIPDSLARHLPIAAIVGKASSKEICNILPDEIETGKQAVTYLAGLGHRRILHATFDTRHSAVVDRAEGYTQKMSELGLEPCILKARDEDQLHEIWRTYKPTACFCHNDWLGLTVMRQLQHLGLSIPHDVSILGVDNSPSFRELCPIISTMSYPMQEIAEATVSWVKKRRKAAPFKPLQIVERQTTAPAQSS